MADAPIVVEQIHEKLEEWERTGPKEDDHRVAVHAVKDVGGPSSFLLLVIAVSFPGGPALQAVGEKMKITGELFEKTKSLRVDKIEPAN